MYTQSFLYRKKGSVTHYRNFCWISIYTKIH